MVSVTTSLPEKTKQWGIPSLDLFAFSLKLRDPCGSGCLHPGLDVGAGVCLPPNSDNPKSPPKIPSREMHPDPSHSLLAQERLLRSPEIPQSGGPNPISPGEKSSDAGYKSSPESQTPQSISLVTEKSILLGRDLSQRVVDTLLLSRKTNTCRSYLKVWKKFAAWANSMFNQSSPDIPLILEFFQDGLDMGLSPNTL